MESINEIKIKFQQLNSLEEFLNFVDEYQGDERKGIVLLVEKARKKILFIDKERSRVEALYTYENQYAKETLVCGLDEVGRGPLAGPVVAAAVILPRDLFIEGINDSKKLSAKQRERIYDFLIENAIDIGIGMVDAPTIDEINILEATKLAMEKALSSLKKKPDVLLIDALSLHTDIPQLGIIKGDQKSASIAAASIIAKVTRDNMMKEYEDIYPGYDFASNMGYGTKAHYEGLNRQGLTKIHRRSFIH